MPWEVDSSEPLITPEAALSYYGDLLGAERKALALPDLLIGTFQQQVLDHMVAETKAGAPARWPTPGFWPLARVAFRGRQVAIARLPIGAPAASAALELMAAAGARTIFLVGSAGSLQPHLPTGSLVIPTSALRHEGTSHHYLDSGDPAAASPELVDALLSAALRRGKSSPRCGAVWTTDAPYRECVDTVARLRTSGVLAVEMEAAALFAVARHRGVRIALLAAISDELGDRWNPGFHTLAYRRALLVAANVVLEAAASLAPATEPHA